MPHPVPRRVATLATVLLLLAAGLVAPAGSASASALAKKRTTTYASLSTTSITVGRTASVRSATRPKQRGHRVSLQQKVGTRWKTVQRKRLGTASRVTFTVRGVTAGTKLFRVYDPATRRYRASLSRTLKLVVKKKPVASSKCTPGYSPCIAPGPDVDCAGGNGDGPRFVEGPVLVSASGQDPYRLDPDRNGLGCG
ncbi:hypothetical protein [Jatrophihabitans fulvus]